MGDGASMQLREHPKISIRQNHSWPPIWTPFGGFWEKHTHILQGEIGVLKKVRYYSTRPGRIFLTTEQRGFDYIGCMLIEDEIFCEELAKHLQHFCGMTIEAIGSLEFPSHLELR
jgi:hypothetical protein